MTIETMWYADYDEDGNHPKCNRLTRLPRPEQLAMAFELALDFDRGAAGYRSTGKNSITGEETWYWPRQPRKYGDWWMLPERTLKLRKRAMDYATQRALEPRKVKVDGPPSLRWTPFNDPVWLHADLVRAELRKLLRRALKAKRAMVNGVPERWSQVERIRAKRLSCRPEPDPHWRDGNIAKWARKRRLQRMEAYGYRGAADHGGE